MNYLTFSKELKKECKNFLKVKYISPLESFLYLFKSVTFVGWGRKRSGLLALKFARLFKKKYLLLEDGFIRSIGLGVENAPRFSLVFDDIGIYYDATAPSRLENILNSYDFKSNKELIETSKRAIAKIIEYKISKYNNFKRYNLSFLNTPQKKVLIVAQTLNDSSLKYGLADRFFTKEIIEEVIRDNPDYKIYLKIHPDVLAGKKESDIRLDEIPNSISIISESINPIELLEHFDRVYTKTSGMGMEALILGKEVYCYGVPFYAGWGLTYDKIRVDRRKRRISIYELFAGAYILYTNYYNPYKNEKADILDIIEFIKKHRALR